MEETGEFPTDLLRKMGDIGILGVITPPEYGGNGMGNLARIIVLEELGRVCPAIPMALQVHHMATHAFNTFGTEEQKKSICLLWQKGRRWGLWQLPILPEDPMSQELKTSAKLDGKTYG